MTRADKWDTSALDPAPRPEELCSVCGQPDNCGECNHQPLTAQERKLLGC